MLRNKYIIDVTTTATIRPSIFQQTFKSFFQNLFADYQQKGHIINLILNIDPIGNKYNDIYTIMGIAQKLFNNIQISIPKIPSFPKAFKHVWSYITPNTDYIFNLEDDWELTQKVDLLKLINIMETEKNLAILRLAAFHAGKDTMKNWNKIFPYNGKYYKCPEELKTGLGFCGHPSLIKANFVQNTVKHIDINRNPEKQYHSKDKTPIMEEVMKWKYGVFSEPGNLPLIKDIGRQWMVENNFKKQGNKAFFTNWERIEK